ncbi:oxidoreductase [Lipomyces tetrasporus]
MTEDLAGKAFVVIGSASGMGLATVRTLAQHGAQLAICDINESALEQVESELAREREARVIIQAVDVTDPEGLKRFLEMAKQRLGKIHGIANFAGTGGHKLGLESIWETHPEEFNFIMDLNVKGTFNVLGETLNRGIWRSLEVCKAPVFAASKHAAAGLIKSAALEVGQRGVRVNCVLPGAVDTPMYQQVLKSAGLSASASVTPIPRPGQPLEIANVTAFLLSDQSSFVSGAAWSVDGGANA